MEKQPTPTQNVQRVKTKLREVDPRVNIIARSGLNTKGNKEVPYEEQAPPAAPAQCQIEEEIGIFLKACLKLLRNPQAVSNLLALMNTCEAWPTLIPETKDMQKLHSSKKCAGNEMRLTAQIGDYEID